MIRNTVFVVALALGLAGCVCVSPEQAVNVNELHDGIVRLMPYAEAGIKTELAAQASIAADSSRTQAEKAAASAKVAELQGLFLETKILPAVSAPIRDWAIAKVGSDKFLKAKANRDARVAGGR